MKTWGRRRLWALASVVGLALSLQLQGSVTAQPAGLDPAPAYLAEQPSVQEISRTALAEAERLGDSYTITVYGVEAGYGFRIGDQYYLPARQVINALGGSLRWQPPRGLRLEVPDRPATTVSMYPLMDRGYLRLADVRDLLPAVRVGEGRITIGADQLRPGLPPTDNGFQAVWLDEMILTTRGLTAFGDIYAPLVTTAQYLAASSRYDALAGLALLEGQPIYAYFSPLAPGVPYVLLDEALQRLQVHAPVHMAPAGESGLDAAEPYMTATAMTATAQPEGTVVYGGVDGSRRIALTFDDYLGPWIPNLLKILYENDVPATFFAIGNSVKAHPDLAQSIVAGGHQLAGHSFNHYDGFTLTMAELRAELAGTRRIIREVTGVDSPFWRPPGGYINAAMIEQAALPLGLTTVLWSVNSNDANPRATQDDVYNAVLKQAFPGAIVAMHTGSPATVQALPRLIAELRAQGYRFVTVAQLLQAEADG